LHIVDQIKIKIIFYASIILGKFIMLELGKKRVGQTKGSKSSSCRWEREEK